MLNIIYKNILFQRSAVIAALLLSFGKLLSQHVISFKEADSHLPIKYCEIKIDNRSFFSDSLGTFNITNAKAFEVTDSRYKKIAARSVSKDSIIFLQPKEFLIEEVIFNAPKILNFEDNVKKSTIFTFSTGYSYGKILKGNFSNDSQLKSITLYNQKPISVPYYLKLDFYHFSINPDLVLREKLNKDNIIIPLYNQTTQQKKFNIDLRKFKIKLKDNSFFVSVQLITDIGSYQQEKITNKILTFYTSKNKGDQYIGRYHNNTMIWTKINPSPSALVAISFSVLESDNPQQ
ncbi:hypothetical protein ATB99_12200 [Elizabethkingia meningoseptica]|uniref:hypothetical protein n=1 Tax=Elizabethkingia meningoseptica TaxID=238 RepID=UPI000332D24B|nr:hypothetical protein [Elizabethkingia meningoseptica]AQX03915.1 hypothetical protein BBD33_01005 [Elizabethkingia meningoseptica]AQX45955.1 hypothetical protein B5G46_01005 [Elizabethkingia meningoseptica]EOR29771.1 hypothetical protein L100_09589 [Elizabethkingia meningoseptica ATCC 13253 = NBRC 12535]KUY15247.1 hypothetical protein ATB99_12200 [Elizabethkingia meningoseptica]OPB69381.1 hypothetical protein BAY30_04410 [Elizabethkingia meningoseptica]